MHGDNKKSIYNIRCFKDASGWKNGECVNIIGRTGYPNIIERKQKINSGHDSINNQRVR